MSQPITTGPGTGRAYGAGYQPTPEGSGYQPAPQGWGYQPSTEGTAHQPPATEGTGYQPAGTITFAVGVDEPAAGGKKVEGKKSDGKKSIFLISIGKGAGLKANDKVIIYSRRKPTEGLGKKKAVDALEEVMVAEGVVMDNLTEDEAWVHVAEADDAKKVMRGDVIKTEHSESTANKGKKLLKMLM